MKHLLQSHKLFFFKKVISVLVILLFFIPSVGYSSHIIGGELNYKCLGGNLYEIKLRVFRDCNKSTNAAYDQTAAIGIFDVSNVLVTTLYINFPGATIITPTIAQKDPCVKIPLNTCVEVAEYIGTVTLAPRVGGYQLVYQRCCRNATINNINNPGSQGATYYARIPDQSISCNSNPVFTKMPPLFVCANNPLIFDNSATDTEGDSISYSICTPFNGANSGSSQPQPPNPPPYNYLTFKAPYTAANPMGGIPLAIDPITGLLTGTPSTVGQFVVGVCANEYRNGTLLSTTKRDFQFNVVSCEPDVAAAAAAFTSDCTNHTVTFTNNSTGSATYKWNFGDSMNPTGTSTLTNPTYKYPTSGTFTVSLIAFSTAGNACNDTLKGFVVVIDTCQPCAMTLGITKVDGTCGAVGGGCSATPITTAQWNSKSIPNPDPCSGTGYFIRYSSPGCATDPYGTSADKAYYVCGVYAGAPDQLADWNVCKEPAATPCPGKGSMVLGSSPLPLNAYACPCVQTPPTGVCTHIVWPVTCPGGIVYIRNYGDGSIVSKSCIAGNGTSTVTGVTTLTPSSIDIELSGVFQAQPPSSPPATITPLANTHAACPATASLTKNGTTITFDYYLWILNGSTGTGSAGNATVTPGSGTAPYNYSWNTNPVQTTATASNLSAGTYTVTVTDAAGCTKTSSVTIDAIGAVTLTSAQTPLSSCSASDGTATVTASGGTPPYTYLWSNGQTTSGISALSAGVYSVNVVDAGGCSKSTIFTITQPTVITVTASKTDALCTPVNGTATATSVGGTGAYNYLWSNGQTTNPAVGLKAGYYIVTATDVNGCSNTAGITIANSTLTLSLSKTDAKCYKGSTGTASVTATNGTPGYSYSWNTSPVQTTATATNLSAGTYIVTVTDNGGCSSSASLIISEPAPLVPEPSNTSTINCSGIANGSAIVVVNGGTPPYTYLWCNAQTASTASALPQGKCAITITDANLCSAIDSVDIVYPVALSLTQLTSNATCNSSNGAATVTPAGGKPGYTYLWNTSPTQTSQTATGLSAGTYTVVVTDNAGCTALINVAINQSGSSITIAQNTTTAGCNQSNGTASATASGGIPGYTYTWNTNPTQSTQTATGLSAGTYIVTVSDNLGCTSSASVIVNNLGAPTATVTSVDVMCNGGNTGTATVIASGGGGTYTYSWNTNPVQTAVTASSLTAGTYIITVTDNLGCIFITSVIVNQPGAISVLPNSTPAGCGLSNGTASVTASGGTPGYTYSWNTNPVQTTQTVGGLSAGAYIVTVTDNSLCTSSASVVVNNTGSPTATISSVDVKCNGGNTGTATVIASGGGGTYTYSWSTVPVQTTVTAGGLTAGTFSVTITDNVGCVFITSVIVNQPNPINILQNSTIAGCNLSNGTASATASGGTSGYSYSWNSSPVQNTQTATGLSAGIYIVTVTDGNSCTATANVTIVGQNGNFPIADFTADSTLTCDGAAVSLTNLSTNATSYFWDFGDGGTSTFKDPTHLYKYGTSATITLIAIDGGCADTITLVINIDPFDNYITPGSTNVFTPNDDGTNDCFEVKVGNGLEKCVEIIVFDRWGLRIYDSETGGACWDGRTTSGSLASEGTYFYTIKIGNYEAHGALSLFR